MDAFSEHENHACMGSLVGVNWHNAPNQRIQLDGMLGVPKSESVSDVDVNIVDDAALVHILDPKKSQVCQNCP